MPRIRFPQNDLARITLLTEVHMTHRSQSEQGNSYLMPETIQGLEELYNHFHHLVVNQTYSERERAEVVQEKLTALKELRTYCSHGLQSVRNRIKRENEPKELYKLYGISASGAMPKLVASADLITIAESIIAGDRSAVGMGYEPMINPRADQIDEINNRAKRLIADVNAADRLVDQAQEEVAEVRAEVDLLIKDIVADLKYNLRKMDAPSRRRVMRRYGVTFV